MAVANVTPEKIRQRANDYNGINCNELLLMADLIESHKELKSMRTEVAALPETYQLNNFKDKHYFYTSEVINFCMNDESSPFKGKVVNPRTVTSWLRSGKLKGIQVEVGLLWYVSKEALLEFFKSRQTVLV